MTDHYLADDADSRTVWNDGCIVPQIISLFRQRMAAALFVPYLHQQYADNRVFSMVRAKKAYNVSMPQPLLISGVSFHFVWGFGEMKRGRGANSRGTLPSPPLKPTNTTFSLSTLNALCDIERWSFTLTLNQCIAMCYCTLHYGTLWTSLRYNLIGSHYSLSLCSFPEEQFPAVD